MHFLALPAVGLLLLTMISLRTEVNARQAATTRPSDGPATREAGGSMRLTDFDNEDANARWRMVNDNVMGGRSKGEVRFADGVMRFVGAINTNGGGFSSVRLPIERGSLAGAKQLVMRLKTDGRTPYRALVIDDAGRRREILHQRELALDGESREWQTVTLDLSKLQPTFHGEPIEAAPLDPAAAVAIGFILNDTGDGPFELQIDWIDVAR